MTADFLTFVIIKITSFRIGYPDSNEEPFSSFQDFWKLENKSDTTNNAQIIYSIMDYGDPVK